MQHVIYFSTYLFIFHLSFYLLTYIFKDFKFKFKNRFLIMWNVFGNSEKFGIQNSEENNTVLNK